jgi:hypothetical protein
MDDTSLPNMDKIQGVRDMYICQHNNTLNQTIYTLNYTQITFFSK